ncbi:response regulator [Mucilaginibacter ginkgonis]|uniref:Response regulator n=1 Tax=Mucilaginibacter ginkgonis TaxID=2682091 RepID=A0A6I4HVS6_9SPHI|nr:response regulator [Mucilaginibacter ginkgonis]QQL49945.1 response regulator [Mucilaginibacter ginkgonis]
MPVTNNSKKILILEDNGDIIELLKEFLPPLGYEVIAFNSVTDIITIIKENKPSIVIIDYLLGSINGGEYCAQIKKNKETEDIPVIMLSGHQRVIESLGNYGWNSFIAKPFDLDELAIEIKKLLNNI